MPGLARKKGPKSLARLTATSLFQSDSHKDWEKEEKELIIFPMSQQAMQSYHEQEQQENMAVNLLSG